MNTTGGAWSPETIAAVISLMGVALSVAGSVIGGALQARKTRAEADRDRADAAHLVSESARELIEPLKLRIEELNAHAALNAQIISDLTRRVAKLEEILDGAHRLARQVRELGHEPVYIPPHTLE